MGSVGLIFTLVLVRHLIGPPGLSRPMTSSSWTHSYSKQSNWKVTKMTDLWHLQNLATCLKNLYIAIQYIYSKIMIVKYSFEIC